MTTTHSLQKFVLPTCCEDINNSASVAFFKALSDPNRLQLIFLLLAEPRSVHDLTKNFSLHTSVISRHLKMLKEAGIVVSTRKGKEVYYSVGTRILADQLRNLADALYSYQPPPVAN